jgi:hypothetical protein
MPSLVIYDNEIVADCASAAFFKMIDREEYELYPISRTDHIDSADLETPCYSRWCSIIVIGTYWKDNYHIMLEMSHAVHVYSFEQFDELKDSVTKESVKFIKPNESKFIVSHADNVKKFGPLSFAINHCLTNGIYSDSNSISNPMSEKFHIFIESFVTTNSELIRIIDQRGMCHNIIGTQSFFTGFHNYFTDNPNDSVTNFTLLFEATVSYQDVLNYGKDILDGTININNGAV